MRLHVPDEIYGSGYYVHTFQKLVPWQEHFSAHPEYFAWMNGKRVIDQPCLSRPEVLDLVVAKLREEMAAQPDKHVWSVSQNDNFSYCQCPECAAAIEEEGSPSGPLIRFVNRVAAAFPDKVISTLAYQYTRPAPRRTRGPRRTSRSCCARSSSTAAGPSPTTPSGRAFVRDLEDWTRICGRVYLWDYTVNFSHFVSPFPNLHVLEPNIRLFMDHGVGRHFQQTNAGPGHEMSELKAYVLSRLLWNPNGGVKAAMKDFLEGYYGKAGPLDQTIPRRPAGRPSNGRRRGSTSTSRRRPMPTASFRQPMSRPITRSSTRPRPPRPATRRRCCGSGPRACR
jgi:hypothetical protein